MDQLYLNLLGLINTWAIFWYAQIFLNSGLCLHPAKSLINNIGHDKSGENCEETNLYYHEKFCEIYPLRFTDSYQINEEIVRNIGNYLRLHKTPFSNKMLKLLKILKKNFFGQKT